MVQYLALIIFFSAPIWLVIFARLLESVYLWQVKEFRLDRVLSHLRYEGSLSLNDEFEFAMRVGLLTLLLLYYLSPTSLVLGISIVMIMIYYDMRAMTDLKKLLFRKIHRPAFRSPRNLLIMLGVLLVVALPYGYLVWGLADLQTIPIYQNIVMQNPPQLSSQLLWNMPLAVVSENLTIISLPILVTIYSLAMGIVADLLLQILVAFFVFVTSPLATLRRKMIMRQARLKMVNLKKLRVVAVTGSYGKTTTKEILFQILQNNFKTVKTAKHVNTEVGIAQTILRSINSDSRVFVAEMGAYKLGETKTCAEIARPDIAIITGIDEQHISLYGSFKAIIDSTLEIVEMLKPGGLVIINGDNEYCLRIAGMIEARKVIYFTNIGQTRVISTGEMRKMPKPILPRDQNMYVSEIEEKEEGLAFTVGFHNDVAKVTTNIKARHNVGNIVAAMIVANELGLDFKQVAKIVDTTEFELPYLTSIPGINNSILIDDGYNINPSGFYAGLEYLASQKTSATKWVLTQGFIELGDERQKTYQQIAKKLVQKAQALMTTDFDLYSAVEEVNPKFKLFYVDNIFDLPYVFKAHVQKSDLVLIEGPLPSQVLTKIKK